MTSHGTGPSSRDEVARVPAGAPAENGDLDRRRAEVIEALDRLAKGVFARCDVCGAEISERRLRIHPAADRCTSHTADRDRPGTDRGTATHDEGTPHDGTLR